jgi:DNA-binding CsgD family transcriptional regulator
VNEKCRGARVAQRACNTEPAVPSGGARGDAGFVQAGLLIARRDWWLQAAMTHYLGSMPIQRHAATEILLYGLFAGALIVLLRLIEYRYLVLQHSAPVYGGLVAVLFAVLGIRLGQRLAKSQTVERVVVRQVRVPADGPFVRDAAAIARLGLTPRECEILELIASGLSNREIAARLFVSENTVKTHSSRLFTKLNAKRRTQAVQIAKDQGLIA